MSNYWVGVFFSCFFVCCCPIICADLRGTASAPLVPAFLLPATPKTHSALRPRPQRFTGGDVRLFVGCHPKETLHCCQVTSVVFNRVCSDSTYAGHRLLCPLRRKSAGVERVKVDCCMQVRLVHSVWPGSLVWVISERGLPPPPPSRLRYTSPAHGKACCCCWSVALRSQKP